MAFFEARFDSSLIILLIGRVLRMVCARIPDDTCPCAMVALGDGPFKSSIFKRMILHHDGQAFVPGIQRRTFGDRPALERAIELQSKIVMEPGRRMLLNDKTKSAGGRL